MFTRNGAKHLDAAFEQFVLDRSPTLLRTAFMLIGDRAEAEDLLQTALLRTALKWRTVRGEPDAYARQVLVNLARDRWRRRKRRPAEHPMDDLPPALAFHHDHADTVVDHQLLAAGLATLSQRQREVLALRYFEDLSVTDTAEIMRTSEGTVKSYTSRALQQLRQFLGDRATDDNDATEASHVR
ncbi:MAG TPA: SigE family RNA polymerase sigma factor [Pseudonocardiaceae bacterium]|nr:SigE family RNA polymerase sigma factor [Pseudonocardiaceae bacterium]